MKIKIPGGIYKECSVFSIKENRIVFFAGSAKSFSEYILISAHTIECEIPDVDTTQVEISALNERMADLCVKHHLAVQAIQGAINNLLAIENQPSEAQ